VVVNLEGNFLIERFVSLVIGFFLQSSVVLKFLIACHVTCYMLSLLSIQNKVKFMMQETKEDEKKFLNNFCS